MFDRGAMDTSDWDYRSNGSLSEGRQTRIE